MEFWQAKFKANISRDSKLCAMLLEEGWSVATVWECALRKPDQVAASTELLAAWLESDNVQIEISEGDASRSWREDREHC